MDALTPRFSRADPNAWSADGDSLHPRESEIVSAIEAERMLEEGAQAVDVRTADAFSRGHVPGAINLPLGLLTAATSHELGPVILYCQAGSDTRWNGGLLRKLFGAENIFIVAHGFEEWQGAGLPVAVGD